MTQTKEVYVQLMEDAQEIGLEIKQDKTKILTQTRRNIPNRQNITIDDHNLESMDHFIYMESNDGSELNEIRRRLMLGNKTYCLSYPS